MNNNKSIFSVKLMLEGFRQCKLIGILATIIVTIGALFIPLAEVISGSNMNYEDIVAEALEAWQANPFLCLIIPAAALMTMVLFHFLNNRPASDMYHALPHKRITLYLSYLGSILLWTLIMLFACTLSSLIACFIASKYVALILSTVLPYAFSILLITLLVIGGILTAMNLTGTVFTNVILTGLILYLPRVSFMILRFAIFDAIPFFNPTAFYGGIFGTETNLMFGFTSVIMEIGGSESAIFRPEWHSIIYTLVLALIYLSVGAWLFCRRRSEAAGQSAPTRMHQHVYRIIITMAYCIIITASLVNNMTVGDINGGDIFAFIILYLVAALIYFVYEIITTRKLRNLINALPGLALVAALNLGLAVGITAVRNYIVDQSPEANEIESISLGVDPELLDMSAHWDLKNYIDMKNDNVKITDKEIIEIMAKYLAENIEVYKSGEHAYYNKYYGQGGEYHTYPVKMYTKSGELNRTVMVPMSESEKVMEIIEKIPEYTEKWKNPPKPIFMNTLCVEAEISCDFDAETTERLYNIYCRELQEESFSDIYNAYYSDSSVISFSYTFSENGYTKRITCPVYNNLMSETTAAYFEAVYDAQAETRNKFKEFSESGDFMNLDVRLIGKNSQGEAINCYSYSEIDTAEFYSPISKYIKDEPISVDGLYAVIYMIPTDYNKHTVSLALSVDKALLDDAYFKEHFAIEEAVDYRYID